MKCSLLSDIRGSLGIAAALPIHGKSDGLRSCSASFGLHSKLDLVGTNGNGSILSPATLQYFVHGAGTLSVATVPFGIDSFAR